MGLVNKVVPLAELEAEGVQWADEILEMSPTAIRFLKSAFLVATDGLAGLQEFAGNATGLYYTTDEAHEGSHRVPREAHARLPQVPAPPVSMTGRHPGRAARPSAFRIWLARRPPRDAARPRSRGVLVGLGAALAVGDAVPPRHGARLPRRRAAAPGRGEPRRTTCPTSAGRRHADDGGAAAGRGGGPRDGAPARGRDRRRHRARRRRRAVAGDGRRAGAARARGCSRSSRRSRTRAGRSRTAIAGWARCSCSCSSGSWRSSGRRTCRPAGSTPLFFAAAIPLGALITAILVVNNLRDIPTDAAAGKRTLAVVLGERRTQAGVRRPAGLAYAVPVVLAVAGARCAAGGAWARARRRCCRCLTLPLASAAAADVATFGEPRQLNLVLKGTARLALVFGLLFAVGLAVGGSAGA